MDSALRSELLPAFGALPLDRIARQDVHEWFDRYSLTAPGGANRVLDVLRQILNYAVACGYLPSNPTRGVTRNSRPKRTRFLSRTEVNRLHAALDAHQGRGSGRQQADIIRLLLLTGCRKGELVGLRWSEVDGHALHLTDSKTGPRVVYLGTRAGGILARQPRTGSQFVFPRLDDPSLTRSSELSLWRKVRREAGIEDARLHDLRHTFASHAVMRSVPLPVVSRLLGHTQARMTLRYAHISDRDTEAAAERVGAAIASILEGGGNRAKAAATSTPASRPRRPAPAARIRDPLKRSPDRSVSDSTTSAEPGLPRRSRMHSLIESHRAAIRALADRHGLQDVRVFGSMARGDADEQSDVDLLVTLPGGKSGLALGALLMDVQDLLGRRVDVVTEGCLHPAFRGRILREAQLL